MTLTLEPLGPMRVEGHLFATLGLIVIAFADRGIRRWLDSRESKGVGESIPIGFRACGRWLTKIRFTSTGSGALLFADDHKKSAKDIWRARSLLNRLSTRRPAIRRSVGCRCPRRTFPSRAV